MNPSRSTQFSIANFRLPIVNIVAVGAVVCVVAGSAMWGTRRLSQRQTTRVEMVIRDRAKPGNKSVNVRRGDRVVFAVKNDDPRNVPYRFRVVGLQRKTVVIEPGESKEVSVVASERGSYVVGCACGNHADREATLIVK